MNKNIIIVFVGGLLVAILVALLVQAMLGGKKDDAPVPVAEARVEILVAARSLNIGHALRANDMRWQSWPESAVFPGAIVRQNNQAVLDAASGRLRRALAESEPVLTTALITGEAGNFLAASLRPGMRAVAIEVSAASMAGGFIGPGDHVDILMTYQVRLHEQDDPEIRQTIERYATETLLENVRIVAVDQQSRREEDKARVARTVTVEVTPANAEKLALASQMGNLRLTLRGLGDEGLIHSDGDLRQMTTDVQVTNILREMAKRRSEDTETGRVRVYQGDNLQTIPVR